MPFTVDQQSAIDARGVNLLVAAAAGSGKTTVLVERVMRLVEEGANIDEMLIVTFTRAASNDMRDKLGRRFSALAASGDSRAREQMERLESASISTLHAFCMNVLRENFEAAGIDPQFRVLDEAEDKQLIDAALTEVLESAYAAGGPDMDALDFARGPEKVRELVRAMYSFLRERPDAEEWTRAALERMEGAGEAWVSVLVEAAGRKLREARAFNAFAMERALLPEGPTAYAEALEEDGRVLAALESLSYDDLRNALAEFKQITVRAPRARKGEEPSATEQALKNEVMQLRKQVKSRVEAAERLVSLDRVHSLRDVAENAGAIRRLVEIARDLDRALTEQKLARAALTFSDLERYTLSCLADERIAKRVRDKYRFVFVDEYQDTSDVQEAILSRVAGPDNRFMVGDVKQSIYRFRQAEPKLFLEKYAAYRQGGENRLIVLKQNFRSRNCVIDFVNHVFRRVMNGGASQILYDEDAMLYPGLAFPGEDAPVELHLIDKSAPEEEETDEDEEELTDAEREGVVIAARIHALRRENPSLRYRDICVITRVRVNSLAYLASALSAEGIPAYADASESYFDALEVMEVISALRLIVNRRRDIDLIAVLRSPLVGMTSRELAEIRAEARGESYLEALTAAAPNHEKAARFLETLDQWRVLARAMSIPALIRRILSDTGFYAYVGALPGGAQRQANLDVLCSRAAAYETAVGGSLAEFLDYAAGMKARGDGDGAHVLSENDDVVRLMTAHKSKGLEFPVVFCSLLGRRFRATRAEDTLIAHRDLGLALMRMDETLNTRRDTLARRAIVQQTALEDRAEELRILYVALTRARERLILTGTCKSLSASLTNWHIAAHFPDYSGSFLDIAGAAILSCPGAEELGGTIDPAAPRVTVTVHRSHGLRLPAAAEDTQKAGLDLLRAARAAAPDPQTRQAMLWKYPHSEGVHAPVKLTASGLTREVIGVTAIPEIMPRPAFLSETGLTATERGTAIHAALRAIDYAPLRGLSDAALRAETARQLAEMRQDGRLSPAEAEAVHPALLSAFLASPIGLRLRAADRVEREWRFNLRLPAAEAIPGAPPSSEVIVQGSIDLCFLEDGQWILVDYKTDRADDIGALSARYAPQLKLYARALTEITPYPVKEALICLVRQGLTIPVTL